MLLHLVNQSCLVAEPYPGQIIVFSQCRTFSVVPKNFYIEQKIGIKFSNIFLILKSIESLYNKGFSKFPKGAPKSKF